MSLSFGILGFLNYGPMSGYDLVKSFESSLQFFWHAQSSHVYLELKKLEKKGYISGETIIQSDRPNKRIFSITKTGKEAFLNWLAEGAGDEATQFKSAFLMKVFFSGNMPPAQSADMLRQFKEDCENYLKKMDAAPETIEHYGSNKEMYQIMCWQFTVEFGYCFIKSCIEWAERCIQKLESIDEQTAKED